MRLKLLLAASLVGVAQLSVAQSIPRRKTEWTIPEVIKWAQDQKKYPWHGWLLYQGSDSLKHHFISRVMDEWAFINIKRVDLQLVDERVYERTSSAPLGYYYVDATQQFVKVKDY